MVYLRRVHLALRGAGARGAWPSKLADPSLHKSLLGKFEKSGPRSVLLSRSKALPEGSRRMRGTMSLISRVCGLLGGLSVYPIM